ncbi:MAG: acetate--CoA ligase family protein [Nitrospirae bacterium]|nr:acetate--CoA ligase family protein [Nitrospirota bacterium]
MVEADQRPSDGWLGCHLASSTQVAYLIHAQTGTAHSAMPQSPPRSTVDSLKPFFHPRSVAVIGASRDPQSIGYRLLESLQASRFAGTIIPVNPNAPEIAGLQVIPSLALVSSPVDLAIIAVPPNAVLTVIDDCAAKQVTAAILITAGFAETGGSGTLLEQQLREKVRQHGIRLIGPNCFGLMNLDPAVRLNATYTPIFPPAGRVAIASESGGLGLAVVTAASRLNLGLSSFVSVGNHTDVTVNDLLEYWEQDQTTDVILLYLETIVDPHRFRQIAERVGRKKPIVILKAGRTQAGQSAAGSHTAALATNETAVDALFTQCGVIRTKTLEEFLALATGLSSQRLPQGRRVGILTNSGGPGVVCADGCAAEGLTVPELSKQTQSELARFLPPTAALRNPVDVIGFASEDQHARAVETMLKADEIDALIIVHVSVRARDNGPVAAGIARGISAARKTIGRDKPVYICWMAEGDLERAFVVDGETIPTYPHPEIPARIINRAVAYDAWRRQPTGQAPRYSDVDLSKVNSICANALSERGTGWLTTEETHALLAAMKLPLVKGSVATSADDAVKLAGKMGFPVAVKLASHKILHKTEIGAVRLNLVDEKAVRDAFEKIRSRLARDHKSEAMEGVLVQPMLSGGIEVMVGMTRDPLFGPLLAFGLGGIHVEILGDVQFRVAPLTDRDAAEMVRGIKGYRLLTGYRGQPAADVKALEAVLLRISQLVEEIPEISELDLNPIFALPTGQGCKIVDARIRIEPPRPAV